MKPRTPYIAMRFEAPDGTVHFTITSDPDDEHVARIVYDETPDEQRKLAEFVATACNNHDALLAERDRLRAALRSVQYWAEEQERMVIPVRCAVRAALAESDTAHAAPGQGE